MIRYYKECEEEQCEEEQCYWTEPPLNPWLKRVNKSNANRHFLIIRLWHFCIVPNTKTNTTLINNNKNHTPNSIPLHMSTCYRKKMARFLFTDNNHFHKHTKSQSLSIPHHQKISEIYILAFCLVQYTGEVTISIHLIFITISVNMAYTIQPSWFFCWMRCTIINTRSHPAWCFAAAFTVYYYGKLCDFFLSLSLSPPPFFLSVFSHSFNRFEENANYFNERKFVVTLHIQWRIRST